MGQTESKTRDIEDFDTIEELISYIGKPNTVQKKHPVYLFYIWDEIKVQVDRGTGIICDIFPIETDSSNNKAEII